LDLLDWLDSQPSYDPRTTTPKVRHKPKLVAGLDVDEDQLDLVELIAKTVRAA